MSRLFLFGLPMLIASMSWAGGYDHGNGGNLLVCRDAKRTTLLDLYEGSLRGETTEALGRFRARNFEEAFPEAVRLFLRRSHDVGDLFLKWFRNRSQDLRFVPSLSSRIAQGTAFPLPVGCHLRQAAVQILYPFPTTQNGILIDRSLWFGSMGQSGLPTDLKIALLIHEYVLRWQDMILGSCSQSRVREITSFLLSDQALALDEKQWNLMISESLLPRSPICQPSPNY